MTQNTDEPSSLLLLVQETEALLEDIFLSGFHSIRSSTIDQLDHLAIRYESYGMEEGQRITAGLKQHLLKCKESFSGSKEETMKALGRMEFYLEHLKSQVCGS